MPIADNEEEEAEDAAKRPYVPELKLPSIQEIPLKRSVHFPTIRFGVDSLPPLHATTCRDNLKSDTNQLDETRRTQSARMHYAPKSPSYVRPGRRTKFHENLNDLSIKRSATIRSFKMLESWTQSLEDGMLKTLLIEVSNVLLEAVYRKLDEDLKEKASDHWIASTLAEEIKYMEYFSLVADEEKKVTVQQEERAKLATILEMERSIEHDLSLQLQELELELAQLQKQNTEKCQAIEDEQRVIQRLDEEYLSLTEEEQEMQRECQMLEFQVGLQRAKLNQMVNEKVHLDFKSNAALERHMIATKGQERHNTVLIQLEHVEAENQALEAAIKQLKEESAELEEKYAKALKKKEEAATLLSTFQESCQQCQEELERTRNCYTPRPDWDRIVNETPELSVKKYDWSIGETLHENLSMDKDGVLDLFVDDVVPKADTSSTYQTGQTKKLVKEMLDWIERLQNHCGVNLHLSQIWHDIEEARVELNRLHYQLDRVVGAGNLGLFSTALGETSPISKPHFLKRRQELITARGTYEEVPLFLRHCGKVRKTMLKKSDVEKLVRKVWVEKRKREERNPLKHIPLEQVLYEKLYRTYGFQPLIAEWGYNLLVALKTFSWDLEIELFLSCLTGAVSDLVFIDQELMIQKCQTQLLRLCQLYKIESFVTERRVLLTDALVALRTFFPLKTSVQLRAVEQAIIRDMHRVKRGGNGSILYIQDILPLNVKYPLGSFVKTIRTQHFKEIQDYNTMLLSELDKRDTDKKGMLPLSAVRNAILTIDPLADPRAVQKLILNGLHVKTLHLKEPVQYKAVLKKLNASCLMKYTLNFDQNAEINWRRRSDGTNPDTTIATFETSRRNVG